MSFQPMACMWLYDNWASGKTDRRLRWLFMVSWCVFVIGIGTSVWLQALMGVLWVWWAVIGRPGDRGLGVASIIRGVYESSHFSLIYFSFHLFSFPYGTFTRNRDMRDWFTTDNAKWMFMSLQLNPRGSRWGSLSPISTPSPSLPYIGD